MKGIIQMNQDSEMLEVYTEDNKRKIGIADRGVVHYFNLWHREIACWIINEKNEILIQRRSPLKKQYPNMLSITAGHIDLNETPINATLREIEEELGIKNVKANELISIGIFKAKNINNYHFKYVYLLKTNKKLEELTMQESEVSELLYIKLEELENMLKIPNNDITFAKQYYTPIIIKKIKEIMEVRYGNRFRG